MKNSISFMHISNLISRSSKIFLIFALMQTSQAFTADNNFNEQEFNENLPPINNAAAPQINIIEHVIDFSQSAHAISISGNLPLFSEVVILHASQNKRKVDSINNLPPVQQKMTRVPSYENMINAIHIAEEINNQLNYLLNMNIIEQEQNM